jgi:hypothetical protein
LTECGNNNQHPEEFYGNVHAIPISLTLRILKVIKNRKRDKSLTPFCSKYL